MKTYASPFISLLFVAALAVPARAFPVADNGSRIDYLFKAKDLSRLSAGAFVQDTEREVDAPGAPNATLDGVRSLVYLSYNLAPWLSVYGACGVGEYKTDAPGSSSDSNGEWALGVRANLLDHPIKDSTFLEDRLEIRAGLHYVMVDTELNGLDAEWGELSGSLTFHIVNEIVGNKDFYPDSLGLYVGPVYSSYTGDDVSEDESLGITGGMEINVNKSVSMGVGVTYFNAATVLGSIDVRF